MNRYLRLGAMLLLVSCGGHTPPRNLDDACAMTDERPEYLMAMRSAEARWGVPVHVQMATIYQESKFVGNAKTPRKFFLGFIPAGRVTSAYGFSQAIDGSWDDYREATGNYGASRTSIDDAADFIGWYMDQASQRLGLSKFDAGSQYLAYHEGIGGYQRGSHNGKAWLMRTSASVNQRAERYRGQLAACGKI